MVFQGILEIIDDQYKQSSTILATQIPVEDWHERMADPTLSDAIMDRIVHNVISGSLGALNSFRDISHALNPSLAAF